MLKLESGVKFAIKLDKMSQIVSSLFCLDNPGGSWRSTLSPRDNKARISW